MLSKSQSEGRSAETTTGAGGKAKRSDVSIMQLLRDLATIPKRMEALEEAVKSMSENVGERISSLENKLRLLESLD